MTDIWDDEGVDMEEPRDEGWLYERLDDAVTEAFGGVGMLKADGNDSKGGEGPKGPEVCGSGRFVGEPW